MKPGVAATWRRIKSRYALIGDKCDGCNYVYFPPRLICPGCRDAKLMQDFKMSGTGKVLSFSIVHIAPEGHDNMVPYILAIVQLKEGPKITNQIVECDENKIKIDMPVELIFRKIIDEEQGGLIHYGFKSRPLILRDANE